MQRIQQQLTIFFLQTGFLCLLLVIQHSNALTLLPGHIRDDVSLSLAESPYLATENLIVHREGRLTVEPGCELQFAKGKQLIVHGTLVARGTPDARIRFTKQNVPSPAPPQQPHHDDVSSFARQRRLYSGADFRLVDGDSVQEGKLQVYYNAKWHYVCSTQYNWTETDANITCKSLGYANGTFYYYNPANNLTSHMKIYTPKCRGHEINLFECPGTVEPEVGLSVCDNQNIVGLMCEGFDNYFAQTQLDNWGGILFQKYAPYYRQQIFGAAFYNISRSVLQYVDVAYAGMIENWQYRVKPRFVYQPASAITVFQYAPTLDNVTVEYSAGNGLNYSNVEAPALLTNSIVRYNRGHGIYAQTRFGNVSVFHSISHDNMGDGLKYVFNNTGWSPLEEVEYSESRYVEFCDSQNPNSYPAYYRFKNPNYVRECFKTFSAESAYKITLHFQKARIRSKYSLYWLEVYDGQTDKNAPIANYTFADGKSPESVLSMSNYMTVKVKFLCTYPSNRQLQPLELRRLLQEQQWEEFKRQQLLYEKKLYEHRGDGDDEPTAPPLPLLDLSSLSLEQQQYQLKLFERQQAQLEQRFQLELQHQQRMMQLGRTYCPLSYQDEITMFAMIGAQKHPDLLTRHAMFVNNSLNGINATAIRSLVQLNQTRIAMNHYLAGLQVHGGAGDVSLYHCQIDSNKMNGVNISYAGGLKEFNYTLVRNNGLYGVHINYRVQQERENIFQNTTLNASWIESNAFDGVHMGAYCNASNITVNATTFVNNQENGLVIRACDYADRYYYNKYDSFNLPFVNQSLFFNGPYFFPQMPNTNMTITWNMFDANRLNGLKIIAIQSMLGLVANNTFRHHTKGSMLITANNTRSTDATIRNVSLSVCYNTFYNNSGRYALSVALNENAAQHTQHINVTFNRFEHNYCYEPYAHLNARSSASAVAVVSSSHVRFQRNWFNNPRSRVQLATHLANQSACINASHNWFAQLQPVYDLHYYVSYRDKCNQQWSTVRGLVFDQANRSNLAQVVYWPYACNERLWWREASVDMRPPLEFDLTSTDALGGVFDMGEAQLPVQRYTVVNDILVKPGAKLVLKSGTELNFLNGVGMLVLGELHVEGHAGSPVRFTLANRDVHNSSNSLYSLSLVDGPSPHDGRLVVRVNGRSGTVCNRGWSVLSSRLVCQQLGFMVDPQLPWYTRWLADDPRRDEPVLMSEVQCDDTLDTTIFECRHTAEHDQTCTHVDDVWVRCVDAGWAGVHVGLLAQPSKVRYAQFERAGVYDYARAEAAAALRFDLMLMHEVSDVSFVQNRYTAMEVLYNAPFNALISSRIPVRNQLKSLGFFENERVGLRTRSSYLSVMNMYAEGHTRFSALEYNPLFDLSLLDTVRNAASQPRHGTNVRRELTRLRHDGRYDFWHINQEPVVMLYTDPEYHFGPRQFNVHIQTTNDRVLVVELIDYNPDFSQEQVMFCEKFCQDSMADKSARQFNLSAHDSLYFPINTSFASLHVSYNVTGAKSGRLAFLVYTAKAPEPTYDYMSPALVYVRNIMPDNAIAVYNSTFVRNRHAIVWKHYEESEDVYGNLRKRYNYTQLIVNNCTFERNDQLVWVNTDPVITNHHQRASNLTVHAMHSLTDSMRDDVLLSELGYQVYDLVPTVKLGPLGRVNVTIEDSVFRQNYGGLRALYRYHEYANTLWHFEIRNNRFSQNRQGCLRVYLPRIYRFAHKGFWRNYTHSLNVRNNEFSQNDLFEFVVDGYYAQMNLTKNLFVDNVCRVGLVKLDGTEKDFFVYDNHIERNEGHFMFESEATSHAENDLDLECLFVDNYLENNVRPRSMMPTQTLPYRIESLQSMREAYNFLVVNAPTSYTIAVRGIQNVTVQRNIISNALFDYEFVGGMTANSINATMDARYNWWGTSNATAIKQRIFDMHEWNNHALVAFVPYYASKMDYSLSRQQPALYNVDDGVLGGLVERDLTLAPLRVPYQVRSDLTVMPGVTLTIEPGVELEFFPNVGLLVLGDLKAAGRLPDALIKMRPVHAQQLRAQMHSSVVSVPNYADDLAKNLYGEQQARKNFERSRDEFYLNASRHLRLLTLTEDGEELLVPDASEGFLQVYNSTLRMWTVVCDRQFTLASASIVCKQMGLEWRNALVKPLHMYMSPHAQRPVWNQTFICHGGEYTLAECDTFANYHMSECRARGEYTYVMCRPYKLAALGYEPWGGVRFAQAHFERNTLQGGSPQPQQQRPFLSGDLVQTPPDNSFMSYVDIVGAGRLHNVLSPAVQLVYRSPTLSNVDIRDSVWHGLETIQARSTASVMSQVSVRGSLGYGVNSLQLNIQTTDQRSSFAVLGANTLSLHNSYSMIDLCDPHKYYMLEQRVLVYYKYTNIARDCVKIFRTKVSAITVGGSGQIGMRFLQLALVNNTVQNDTIEIFNGTLFEHKYLMATLMNSTTTSTDSFFLSKTDILSVFMKASVGREYFGFIAEVLLYPNAQYLSPEAYVELSDSELTGNQLGAFSYVSAGERNPHLYMLRNRIEHNGIAYFNATTPPAVQLILQNTPRFYFGNNFVEMNYGGVTVLLHSGSGVLITRSIVFNNLFMGNYNDTTLMASAYALQLPYNELMVYKNVFVENYSPRTDIVHIAAVLSEFTRNQVIKNYGCRIVYTQGFENVTTPRNQEISYNLLRENYAFGIRNELEDANRFRSTMVAASLKQVYYGNYLYNKYNDFELTSLTDPYSLALWQATHLYPYLGGSGGGNGPGAAFITPATPVDPSDSSTNSPSPQLLMPLMTYTGSINASFNYWSTDSETQIRARIRDKYDNWTLYEVTYSPAILNEFTLRDGKCELGWSLLDDTCYTYVGSYVTYRDAELICAKFDARLARETVAPIKLPRFRQLARNMQYNYEAQSFRRMWLYTESVTANNGGLLSSTSLCNVVEDYGMTQTRCLAEQLPFVCEKDPVFLGAAFRFKDELAFALAALAALLVCVCLLCVLWAVKSRQRKKEHMARQDTLRRSTRNNHLHFVNSTMTSGGGGAGGKSTSIYVSSGGSMATEPPPPPQLQQQRSLNGSQTNIYNSRRNQYFASKAHRANSKQSSESGDDAATVVSKMPFSDADLDAKYHEYDSKNSDRQKIIQRPAEYTSDSDTTNTDETQVAAVTTPRFGTSKSSDSSSTPPPPPPRPVKQFTTSYDQLMNTTTTDQDEDTSSVTLDSKRLLTNKVNQSRPPAPPAPPPPPQFSTFGKKQEDGTSSFSTSTNTLSKSNMTSITPLPVGPPAPAPPLTLYNKIMSRVPVVTMDIKENYENLANQTSGKPLPAIYKPATDSSALSSDLESSVQSVQLITSASLLLNRGARPDLRDAQRVQSSGFDTSAVKPRTLPQHFVLPAVTTPPPPPPPLPPPSLQFVGRLPPPPKMEYGGGKFSSPAPSVDYNSAAHRLPNVYQPPPVPLTRQQNIPIVFTQSDSTQVPSLNHSINDSLQYHPQPQQQQQHVDGDPSKPPPLETAI